MGIDGKGIEGCIDDMGYSRARHSDNGSLWKNRERWPSGVFVGKCWERIPVAVWYEEFSREVLEVQVEFGGCGLIKPTLKFNTWIYYMIGHMTCESI